MLGRRAKAERLANPASKMAEQVVVDVFMRPSEGRNSMLLRKRPSENHADKNTVYLTDFFQIWPTCVTLLVHRPCATFLPNCLLFRRNVNQNVGHWKVIKIEVKIYAMFNTPVQA